MAVITIAEMSDDDKQVYLCNRVMRRGAVKEITAGKKYLISIAELKDTATLGTENADEVVKYETIIDCQAPATIPVGTKVQLALDVQLRIDGV